MRGAARGSRLDRRSRPIDFGRVTAAARTIAPLVGLAFGSKKCVPEIWRSRSFGSAVLDRVQTIAPAAIAATVMHSAFVSRSRPICHEARLAAEAADDHKKMYDPSRDRQIGCAS